MIDQDTKQPVHIYIDICTTGCGTLCQDNAYHTELWASDAFWAYITSPCNFISLVASTLVEIAADSIGLPHFTKSPVTYIYTLGTFSW